jgi:hypothetical protein
MKPYREQVKKYREKITKAWEKKRESKNMEKEGEQEIEHKKRDLCKWLKPNRKAIPVEEEKKEIV